MNNRELFELLGEVDDSFVEAAAESRCHGKGEPPMKTKSGRIGRRVLLIAAAVMLLTAFAAVAYAQNFFGLRELTLAETERFDGPGVIASGAGGPGTEEYAAAREWTEYYEAHLAECRADGGPLDSSSLADGWATAGDARRAGAYYFYGCWDREMIETLLGIAEEHGLRLHTEWESAVGYDELMEKAAAGRIAPAGYDLCGYCYEDGSYKADAIRFPEELGVQYMSFIRMVRGSMPVFNLFLFEGEEIEEEDYISAGGFPLHIMVSRGENWDSALVSYEAENSVMTLSFRSEEGENLDLAKLRAELDRFDFSKTDG